MTFSGWESSGYLGLTGYLVVTLLASGLKIQLPGITGTMSVSHVFILLSIIELKPPETILLSCAAVAAQTYWHTKKRATPIQALFNISNGATASALACAVYHFNAAASLGIHRDLLLGASACTFFFANTIPIAGVLSLTEHRNMRKLWLECYFWSFPYYLVGASIAAVLSHLRGYLNLELSILLLPVLYVLYRSYFLYMGRLEAEKTHAENEQKHAEAMAALHLRTIEAMALSIEAKDATTHQHLERVQVYAVAVGKELGVSESELEALRAAAILHDIGKLAVPEHIISKPGKLTPEEFEKMKIHPLVGAAILERVQFPYPVAPIVRHHHERWDGSGYPDGIGGEDIPIGARILAAVDCLDALASDRQYRRALPLDQAMRMVAEGAGKSFDPKVVGVLQRKYRELEEVAKAAVGKIHSHEMPKVTRGDAPAAGFEIAKAPAQQQPDFLSSIAAARQEMQMLYELTNDLGSSLSLQQTLSMLDARLKRMIPYNTMVFYTLKDQCLTPEYVQGDDSHLLSSLNIAMGEGLSGWVAQNLKPIINGDPILEAGCMADGDYGRLRSALAVPLEGVNGIVGVLTLYSTEQDAFSRDHVRVVLAISSKASLAIENALQHRQAELSATTDGLTGLPNARSLFLRLDSELSRCRRDDVPLTVLVCDLDGFKQVNDRYGHVAGNKVLKLVAQRLLANCREYDYVARMGGDEFVLILPGTRQEAVEMRAAALNRLVRRIGVEVCGEELLSISIGDAYYPAHGVDAEQLLAHADRRMYKVKQEHRAMAIEQASLPELKMLSAAIQ